MDSHLAKPFLPNTLLAAVVRAATAAPAHGEGVGPGLIPVPSILVAPPPVPVIGGELLVLDLVAFDRTAAFLTPEAVASYLKTIAERAEALLSDLRGAGRPDQQGA